MAPLKLHVFPLAETRHGVVIELANPAVVLCALLALPREVRYNVQDRDSDQSYQCGRHPDLAPHFALHVSIHGDLDPRLLGHFPSCLPS